MLTFISITQLAFTVCLKSVFFSIFLVCIALHCFVRVLSAVFRIAVEKIVTVLDLDITIYEIKPPDVSDLAEIKKSVAQEKNQPLRAQSDSDDRGGKGTWKMRTVREDYSYSQRWDDRSPGPANNTTPASSENKSGFSDSNKNNNSNNSRGNPTRTTTTTTTAAVSDSTPLRLVIPEREELSFVTPSLKSAVSPYHRR